VVSEAIAVAAAAVVLALLRLAAVELDARAHRRGKKRTRRQDDRTHIR